MVMGWVEVGLDSMLVEIAALVGAGASLYAIWCLHQLAQDLDAEMDALRTPLGQLAQVLERLPLEELGSAESQITPVQAFLMNLVQEKMHPAVQVTEIRERDKKGQWKNNNE